MEKSKVYMLSVLLCHCKDTQIKGSTGNFCGVFSIIIKTQIQIFCHHQKAEIVKIQLISSSVLMKTNTIKEEKI